MGCHKNTNCERKPTSGSLGKQPCMLFMPTAYHIFCCCTTTAEDLPPLVLPPIEYPGILAPAAKDININSQIMDTYTNSILAGQ